MPSRCLIIGTRASSIRRAIRLLPPRGTITSTNSVIVISLPTAARSAVPDDLHGVLRQPGRFQPFADQFRERRVAFERLGAAAQNRRVAGFETQRGGVDRHVRPRFVNDADHAERHAHLADLDAGRAELEAADLADRIGQRRHLPQAFDHRVQRLVGERQAVDERGVVALLARAGEIARVRFLQRGAIALDRVRHRFERRVFRGRRCARHRARRVACAAAQIGHVFVDVHRGSLAVLSPLAGPWMST